MAMVGEHTTDSDPVIHEFDTVNGDDAGAGKAICRILSYGCRDCDLPDATGSWPDAWVALEEANAHREKTGHNVILLAEKVA